MPLFPLLKLPSLFFPSSPKLIINSGKKLLKYQDE